MESRLEFHQGNVKAVFRLNRKNVYHNTKVKVPASSLDTKGYVKPSAHENWQNLNEQIKLQKKVLDEAILKDLRENGNIDVDRIKFSLKFKAVEEVVEVVDKTSASFLDAVKDFIAHQPKMDRGLKWRFNTLKAIIQKNDRPMVKVRPDYLLDVLDTFRKNVNANTAGTRYKNFRRLINWCIDNQYPIPKLDWNHFRKPTFKPDFIYLTDERVDELYNYIPKTDFERKIKEIFLVLIYTGMRYSDYESLTSSDIHNNCIDKVAKKVKVRFKVPIHPRIAEILKNPPKMVGQVFNRNLQELGISLKWTEEIRFQSDMETFETLPFNEMLCSSVGRHTFATRALMANVPHNVIMGWCGWKNVGMLMYYAEKLKVESTSWIEKMK
jgi:integrase